MSKKRCRIFVIFSLFFINVDASCIKTNSFPNSNVTQIFSENFYAETTSSSHDRCSLVIKPVENGSFIFKIRQIETKIDDFPRELVFITETISIPLTSQSLRVSGFISSEPLEIVYRFRQTPGVSLHRFLLEWRFETRGNDECPNEWKCNCFNECSNHQKFCPFCSLGTDDQCRSNEIWCLPSSSQSPFCVSRDIPIFCAESTRSIQCDRTIPFYNSDGFLTEKNLLVGQSLCLVIRSQYPVDLQILQMFNVDFVKYEQNSTTIVRFIKFNETSRLNFTWSRQFCPNGQNLCSDQGEKRCYSSAQRCDGRWDCENGDDEFSCSKVCPLSFLCPDPHRHACFHLSDRCNGHSTCSSHFDEELCSSNQCNSNNGSFLCRNRRCIYEVWRCDGTNDCGDNSDEEFCHFRPHRGVITTAVIGVMTCSMIFVFVLTCSCKFFSIRRSFRFFHRSSNTNVDDQLLAPPSYNQTIGLTDEQDERLALLMDHLRLAGFAEVMSISQPSSFPGRPALNRESPPAYFPSEQTHSSSDTDDEKLLIP